MKFKSLTIALCTLGLVASVPAVKIAIAQTELTALEEKIRQWEAEDIELNKTCDRVTQAEANSTSEGSAFFDEFKRVNLTDEQRSTYDALLTQLGENREEVYKNSLSIVNPIAYLSFGNPGDFESIPQDVQTAIWAALEKGPKFDQKAALDREFGEYGEFYGSYINYTTPEQKAQLAQITEDFYTQVQGIMTPEQLPQYQENLVAKLKIDEACDYSKVPFSPYPPYGRVVDSILELLQ